MSKIDIFEDFENEEELKSKQTFICSKCGSKINYSSVKNNFAYCKGCNSITKTQSNRENIDNSNSLFKIINQNIDNELLFKISYINSNKVIFNLLLGITLLFSAFFKFNFPFVSIFIGILSIFFFIFAIISFLDPFYLKVTDESIEIYSKFNTIRKRRFTLKNIKQIYVKEFAKMSGREVSGASRYTRKQVTYAIEDRYSLVIKYKYRDDKVIINSLKEYKNLLSLERIIEDWLEIKDEKVENECRNKVTRT